MALRSSRIITSLRALIALTLCLEGTVALAASAARSQSQSFDEAAARFFESRGRRSLDKNAYESRVAYDQLDAQAVPTWQSKAELKRAFLAVRDARFLEAEDRPDFERRESWLYPDDGCFARAALMGQNLAKWGYARPAKVFSFGSLNVRTRNSPDGEVSWWYHVAPIVKVEGVLYVIDPAIDPNEPLSLDQWLLLQVSSLDNVKVSLCNKYTYEPDDSCAGATSSTEGAAHSDQVRYLDDEWERQVDLDRDPEQVLGDHPPWQSH